MTGCGGWVHSSVDSHQSARTLAAQAGCPRSPPSKRSPGIARQQPPFPVNQGPGLCGRSPPSSWSCFHPQRVLIALGYSVVKTKQKTVILIPCCKIHENPLRAGPKVIFVSPAEKFSTQMTVTKQSGRRMMANPLQGGKVLIFPLPFHDLAQPSALTAPFAAPLRLFLGEQDANRHLPQSALSSPPFARTKCWMGSVLGHRVSSRSWFTTASVL